MEMTVSRVEGRVPVTILRVSGDVDGATYEALIRKGRELHAAGARDLLIDLGGVRYLSSAGVVALHHLALLMRGEQPPDPESGWEALHAVAREQASGPQPHLKLLNPQPKVDKVLDMVGFKAFIEVHADQAAAVASF